MVVRVVQGQNDAFEDSKFFASPSSSVVSIRNRKSRAPLPPVGSVVAGAPDTSCLCEMGKQEHIFFQLPLSREESSRRPPSRSLPSVSVNRTDPMALLLIRKVEQVKVWRFFSCCCAMWPVLGGRAVRSALGPSTAYRLYP